MPPHLSLDRPQNTHAQFGVFMNTENYEALVGRAKAQMQRKNDSLRQQGLLSGAGGSWFVDQPTEAITFTHADGKRVAGSVQFIGTYIVQEANWLWAWNNMSVLAPLRRDAWAVRVFGAERGMTQLTTPTFTCAEEDCWGFAALACHLNTSQGAYCGQHAGLFSIVANFFTFDKLEIVP